MSLYAERVLSVMRRGMSYSCQRCPSLGQDEKEEICEIVKNFPFKYELCFKDEGKYTMIILQKVL